MCQKNQSNKLKEDSFETDFSFTEGCCSFGENFSSINNLSIGTDLVSSYEMEIGELNNEDQIDSNDEDNELNNLEYYTLNSTADQMSQTQIDRVIEDEDVSTSSIKDIEKDVKSGNTEADNELKIETTQDQTFLCEGYKRMKVVKDKNGEYEVKVKNNQMTGDTMRKYNCPVVGHRMLKIYSNIKFREIYIKCKKVFSKMGIDWLNSQFIWSWMHFKLNPINNSDHLEREIIDNLEIRKICTEKSILKKIVEFDDIPYRYCVLAILKVTREYVSVFDGFYCLNAHIDNDLYRMLCDRKIGDKIYVFGMELFIKEPMSIYEAIKAKDMEILKLSSNGTKICYSLSEKLGYKRKKISFLNQLKHINISGGIISSLILKVEKVIEEKYSVRIENYHSQVKDLEAEYHKISDLMKKANRELKLENVIIKKYYKLLVSDNTEECLLTWWNPKTEIKIGEIYEFVYLITAKSSLGLHLLTTNRTYVNKRIIKK